MVKTSRYLHVGPGGMNCTCCFPAPRSKDRRKRWRSAKRKADREAMRNAMADLVDDHWMELEELNAEYEKAYGPYGSPFDYWSDYYDLEDLDLQQEDDYASDDHFFATYDDDDYGDSYEDWGDCYYTIQSEQEKVARAMCIAMTGTEFGWVMHLDHARKFMEAMKRNG